MNISYIRKTERKVGEVAKKFKEEVESKGISVVGEGNINAGKGKIVYFSKESWTGAVIKADKALLGLLPSAAFVWEENGHVFIGLANPELLNGSPSAHEIAGLIKEIGDTLKNAVNEAAGVSAPKLEAVKLYSTATCPYCKMEKAYLEKNNVPFSLIMVDQDQAAAEEMVRKTGQMGVPVTEVSYDDGDSEIIVGFDRDRLNTLLNIKA